MTRRQLLTLVASGLSTSSAVMAQHAGMGSQVADQTPPVGPADVTLRIAETTIELGPRRVVKTLAYNGQVPGPLLRVKEGRPLTVDVWNDTRDEEFVHWHGLHIPSEVDGAREEGTPPVPSRGGHRRYVFTYRYQSINGRMLGAGEPVRVRQGQRVLFRILNASATMIHRLGMPGHLFHVVALEGYPVPTPRSVPVVAIGPGERIDALVEMNESGIWIVGELDSAQRAAGMGIVVEYAERTAAPQWKPVDPIPWDYTVFGGDGSASEPDGRLSLVFRSTTNGHRWTINGQSHPRTDDILVEANRRYRWVLDNKSAHPHPIHLHRHTFDVVRIADAACSGIRKDVIVVPAWQQVEVDVSASQPGLSLFHCHQQLHMEMGFMSLMRYSS